MLLPNACAYIWWFGRSWAEGCLGRGASAGRKAGAPFSSTLFYGLCFAFQGWCWSYGHHPKKKAADRVESARRKGWTLAARAWELFGEFANVVGRGVVREMMVSAWTICSYFWSLLSGWDGCGWLEGRSPVLLMPFMFRVTFQLLLACPPYEDAGSERIPKQMRRLGGAERVYAFLRLRTYTCICQVMGNIGPPHSSQLPEIGPPSRWKLPFHMSRRSTKCCKQPLSSVEAGGVAHALSWRLPQRGNI